MRKLPESLQYWSLFIGLILGIFLVLYAAWVYLVPSAWKGGVLVVFQPKPLGITAQAGQRLVETSCSGTLLPDAFEPEIQDDTCAFSAYAQPWKHSYITLNTYYPSQVKDVDTDWRTRWQRLDAQLASRDEVLWGGKKAIRYVEYYPQNKESMVTYLLLLDDALPLRNNIAIKEFELRAWYTSQTDKDLAQSTIEQWQWRF